MPIDSQMQAMNYESLYERVEVRGMARDAMTMPQTFASWGKEQVFQVPGMATWPARKWLGAFLLAITGIEWVVTGTSLDLLEMPRHDPEKPLVPHERTTDDPLMMLPLWLVELTRDNISGPAMMQFVDGVMLDKHALDKPIYLQRAR